MPELPEVESVCRDLDAVLTGQIIDSTKTHREGLRAPFSPALKTIANVKVQRISRRAKYILIHLANDHILALHLGMSGRILVKNKGYEAGKHDHFIMHLKNGRQVVLNDPRRFGAALLIPVDEIDDHPA